MCSLIPKVPSTVRAVGKHEIATFAATPITERSPQHVLQCPVMRSDEDLANSKDEDVDLQAINAKLTAALRPW